MRWMRIRNPASLTLSLLEGERQAVGCSGRRAGGGSSSSSELPSVSRRFLKYPTIKKI